MAGKILPRNLLGTLTAILVLLSCTLVLEASDNSTVNYGSNSNITAHTICKKVTNNSATGFSVYVPTQTSEEWASFYGSPPAGIAIGDCAVPVTIAVSQSNADLCAAAGNPSTPGNYVFTIPAGTVLSSNSTSQAALTTGTCWAPGSTITIINNGAIYGRGGNGANANTTSAVACSGFGGGSGGPAMILSYPVTINTANGYIFGGGGGGGSGAAVRGTGNCGALTTGGGGGQGSISSSGGSGSQINPGGSGGSASGPGAGGTGRLVDGRSCVTNGGSGGVAGSAGNAGGSCCWGAGCGSGGGGGAAGRAIQTNGYTVTWQGGNDATHVKGAVQ